MKLSEKEHSKVTDPKYSASLLGAEMTHLGPEKAAFGK